jgi:hypothetical protein
MEERQSCYAAHAGGFWGSRAGHRVPWRTLLSLARAATVLRQHLGVERRWTSPGEAVTWFTTQGWEVDRLGELLFRDDPELPGGLYGVRARLRLAYLRHVDSINSVFSELLHHHGVETLGLSFAGEVLAGRRPDKEPMAVIVRSYTVPLASSAPVPPPGPPGPTPSAAIPKSSTRWRRSGTARPPKLIRTTPTADLPSRSYTSSGRPGAGGPTPTAARRRPSTAWRRRGTVRPRRLTRAMRIAGSTSQSCTDSGRSAVGRPTPCAARPRRSTRWRKSGTARPPRPTHPPSSRSCCLSRTSSHRGWSHRLVRSVGGARAVKTTPSGERALAGRFPGRRRHVATRSV